MEKFYILSDANIIGAMGLMPCNIRMDFYSFLRGECKVDIPFEFKRNVGSTLYDHVLGGDVCLQLFNNCFFDSLQKNGVSGYNSVPTVINLKEKITDYSCLQVLGRASGEDLTNGEILNKGSRVQGGPALIVKKGIYFDYSSWDGSDIFLLEGKAYVFVTEKVKDIISDLQLSNVRMISTDEIERDIEALALNKPELK